MRKLTLLLGFTVVCQLCFSQMSADDLIKEYKNKKGVEYVNVGGFLMKLGKMFMDDESKKEMKGMDIKKVTVLSLEECSPALRAEFAEKAKKMDTQKYELLMTAKEEDEMIYIYGISKKDYLKEVMILTIDSDECALIRMKGKFSLDQIKSNEYKVKITDGRFD